MVDNEDYERLSKHRWSFRIYAIRSIQKNGKQRVIYMHREVLGRRIKEGLYTDHINRNRLDNRKKNLRVVTYMQNNCNTTKKAKNKSGYKGVSWDKLLNKWRVQIGANKKNHYIGVFTSRLKAYKAYCEAVKQYHGEYGRVK